MYVVLVVQLRVDNHPATCDAESLIRIISRKILRLFFFRTAESALKSFFAGGVGGALGKPTYSHFHFMYIL